VTSHTIGMIAGGGRRDVRRPFVLFAALAVVVAFVRLPRAATVDEHPLQLSVSEAAGVYSVSARFAVAGAAGAAVQVLTDYERIPQFMPGVKTSIVRDRTADRVLVEQDALSKFLLFSKRMHLLLEVRQSGQRIRFRDIAGDSFTRYEGSWQVSDDHGATVIDYELTAAPAFAVPAPVLRRLLKRDSADMVSQLRREIARRARYTSPACSSPAFSSSTTNN
jgi:ribosome-associated toxin RatA of RatAB toxin-antitoxin module